MVRPLFHTRSGEVIQLRRDKCTRLGEQAWLKREWRGARSLCIVVLNGLVFPRLRKLFACVCGVGLEGLSPIGVWDVLDGWAHGGHGTV